MSHAEAQKPVYHENAIQKNLAILRTELTDPQFCESVRSGNPVALQNILAYAVANTDFYQHYDCKAGLQSFPVMNKLTLMGQYDAHLSKEYLNQTVYTRHTSGSTGIPFAIVQDAEKKDRHVADLKYFGELCGYRDHAPMCYLRPEATATPEEQEQQRIWQLSIFDLTDAKLQDYYHILVEKKCTALIAYASSLDTAVTCWAKHFKNTSCVKSVISTSEALTDATRQKLQDFFGSDCKVVARYSNLENGILGQETEKNRYLMNWSSYYFEVLKLDSDETAAPGELGRIVVTDLYNKAFPMIRYDTCDVARLVTPAQGFPYLEDLYGRRMDLIYDTKGEVISPFLLSRAMLQAQHIAQWQFIQNTETQYVLKIADAQNEKPDMTPQVAHFQSVLGAGADIQVEYVPDIPVLNSLKRKLIVSNLKK